MTAMRPGAATTSAQAAVGGETGLRTRLPWGRCVGAPARPALVPRARRSRRGPQHGAAADPRWAERRCVQGPGRPARREAVDRAIRRRGRRAARRGHRVAAVDARPAGRRPRVGDPGRPATGRGRPETRPGRPARGHGRRAPARARRGRARAPHAAGRARHGRAGRRPGPRVRVDPAGRVGRLAACDRRPGVEAGQPGRRQGSGRPTAPCGATAWAAGRHGVRPCGAVPWPRAPACGAGRAAPHRA